MGNKASQAFHWPTTNSEVKTRLGVLCFGQMQAVEGAKEVLDGEPSVDPMRDQGQKLGGEAVRAL